MKKVEFKQQQPDSYSGLSLLPFTPLTPTQQEFCQDFRESPKGIYVLKGCPGTGKTFIAMHEALKQLATSRKYDRIVIVRSPVQTRDMGFMPGTKEEKEILYFEPYPIIVRDLTGNTKAWLTYTDMGMIEVVGTAFLRGLTFSNTIFIVDEFQNCNFHELDTVITRLGKNSSIIFCGDFMQSDLTKMTEKNSTKHFINILSTMKDVSMYDFGWQDIVRNELVRNYMFAKENYMSNEKFND